MLKLKTLKILKIVKFFQILLFGNINFRSFFKLYKVKSIHILINIKQLYLYYWEFIFFIIVNFNKQKCFSIKLCFYQINLWI